MENSNKVVVPCYGIVVTKHPNGTVDVTDSDLNNVTKLDRMHMSLEREQRYWAVVEVIHLMVSHHVLAGIDVTTPAYTSGLEKTIHDTLFKEE